MHEFTGIWITDPALAAVRPRDVFCHTEKWLRSLPPSEQNLHILFRRRFTVGAFRRAILYFSADDYAKLYLNGREIAMGPAPSYHFQMGYVTVDVTDALREGENVLAAHTYYQGLSNRQWQSGDCRHGLLLDLEADGTCVLASDEQFRTARHTGYRAIGQYGYQTGFAEAYDSRSPEADFAAPDFDDRAWDFAACRVWADYTMVPQMSSAPCLETVKPTVRKQTGNRVFLDFGGVRVGYLRAEATGPRDSEITIRCAQELWEDGTLRWQLRVGNVDYEEPWTLSGGKDTLDWFDYKAFRYAELILPEGCELGEVSLLCRHYPFTLRASLRREFADDDAIRRVWELCVNTLHYGPQEVMQDCMERERGCYIADSTYTCLAFDLLTGDGSLSRKLLDDGFASARVTETLGCGTACTLVHNVAEYPLIFCRLPLWYYRLHGDRVQLDRDYERVRAVLDGYRRDYEREGLLGHMDKWCVIEWPKGYRDGYAVDPPGHGIVEEPHLVLNAHYYEAIRHANAMAKTLGLPPYRDAEPVRAATVAAFYDEKTHLFRDCQASDHASYIGNVFALAYGLAPEPACEAVITAMIAERKLSAVNIFGTFPILQYFTRRGDTEMLRKLFRDEGAWLNMLAEGADVTFEAWSRDAKQNASLFHNTLAYGAAFLVEGDLQGLFEV